MKHRHTKILGRILGSLVFACAVAQAALADPQGWNGPGWYVSGSAPVNILPATPAYVLFNGPHVSQGDCALIYDQFYSPIGLCRFLGTKPGLQGSPPGEMR